LVDNGHREIVLTGIHLGHYGVEWSRGKSKDDWCRLSHLLERLASLPGEFRLRLSSIEATEVTRELIAVMAAHPERICPHLHISMQSGSDDVLRRMRRRWGRQRFIDRCRLVKEKLDLPSLTTDVIVGFPGESDADFADTCRACEEVGFSKIHIFPFSARRGTPAATMADQTPPDVKAGRVRELAALEADLRQRYFAELRGRELEVLVESCQGGSRLVGTACRYAPVRLPGDADSVGRLLRVTAGDVIDGMVQALCPSMV
jgi:threonylcarbamoyladenosine tRNA methylthiotransferase MtaB